MVFHLPPQGQVGDYKTYQIQQPRTEKTRIASCEAAGCPNWEFGWRTVVPLNSPQADYIRKESGRKLTEEPDMSSGMTCFTFYPGQQCFAEHHVPDRPQLFAVRDGDWRGNPTGRRRMHSNGKFWVEDFAEHQARLAEQIEKG